MAKDRVRVLDARGDPVAADTVSSLESTVDTFSDRIQRKLREQQERDDASQKAAEVRRTNLLQAMQTIRKALAETCKIKMGSRFRLELEVSDWEGWPRLELNLHDSQIPQDIRYGLIVGINDHHNRGAIKFHLRSGELVNRVELSDPLAYNRIPLVLKKTVRSFLDQITEYVLNPVKASETIAAQTRCIEVKETDLHSDNLKKADLFSDDFLGTDRNRAEGAAVDNPLQNINFERLQKGK